MSYGSMQKETVMRRLNEICQPYEVEHARAAFDGDVEAAFSLYCGLNNDMRGVVAKAMWHCKVPVGAFRVYLNSAWTHNHLEVIDAAQNRRTLGSMFRYAAFPPPAELPDVVTVWRGTSYLPFEEAKTGYSWSTDRDVARSFSMPFAGRSRSSLVLTADVAKSDIALFCNHRQESEVVLMRPPDARIDGDLSDWTACLKRKQDATSSNLGVDRSLLPPTEN